MTRALWSLPSSSSHQPGSARLPVAQSEWTLNLIIVSVTRAIRVIRVPLIGDLLSN